MDLHADDLVKLVLASLMGAAIGFERESHGQAAGIRTNILVCTGACLMMLLSLHMEEMFRALSVADSVVRLDPGRIASYAIASMGFLGAGAIIKGKGSIKGLTTAAGLWLVTGIGLSTGAGFVIPAEAHCGGTDLVDCAPGVEREEPFRQLGRIVPARLRSERCSPRGALLSAPPL